MKKGYQRPIEFFQSLHHRDEKVLTPEELELKNDIKELSDANKVLFPN